MVLIATTDIVFAQQLVEIIPGEKSVLLMAERPISEVEPGFLPPPITDLPARAEAGQRWLRNNVYEREPEVLLLDVAFGGSLYRAIESVPRIIERGTRVVLLVPFERDSVEDVAVAMGCFDVINRQASGFFDHVCEAVLSALQAQPLGAPSRAPLRRQMH